MAGNERDDPKASRPRSTRGWSRASALLKGGAPLWEGQGRAIAVMSVGVLLSTAGFFSMRSQEIHRERLAFEHRGEEIASNVRSGFAVPAEVMNALPPFFVAMKQVDREAFREFVGPAVRRHKSLAILEWAPYVRDGERDAFEQSVRDEGLQGFEIREPGDGGAMARAARRPYYFPLIFMEPWVSPVAGFDVVFDEARRSRYAPAIEGAQTIASPRFELVEDPKGVYSVTLVSPIFERNAIVDTPERRWAALRGIVIEVFRIGRVIEAALQGRDLAGIDLVLEDESAPADLRLLHETRPGAATTLHAGGLPSTSTSFLMANRTWAVSVVAREPAAAGLVPWATLLGGLLISVIVAGALGAKTAIGRMRKAVEAAQQLGQYRLVRKLGEGGMGVVYEAHHAMLRRPTAVKLLSPSAALSESTLARFEREVRVTSRLTHPNTIAIYDYGRTPEGVFYYAMEYLDGITFDDLAEYEAPVPAPRVVHLLLQVCGSLAEAHASGLVHRDIKPANLMLGARGGVADFVKVLDFGLVKDLQDRESRKELRTEVVGTPQFISPEGVIAPRKERPATDIYALAAVAYLLLTGNDVFERLSTTELLVAHVKQAPKPPSSRTANPIPPRLDALILRCLEKNPALRPASARELADELRACEIAPWTIADAEGWWATRGKVVLEKIATKRAATARETLDDLAIDLGRLRR